MQHQAKRNTSNFSVLEINYSINVIDEKKLSDREEEVLKLLLAGYLQKQIASKLQISESRVNDVKRIVMKKWSVSNNIEFFLVALNKGYLNHRVMLSSGLLKYDSNSTMMARPILVYTSAKFRDEI